MTDVCGLTIQNEVFLLRWKGNRAHLTERLGLQKRDEELSPSQKRLRIVAKLQNFNAKGSPCPDWAKGALVYAATQPPHAAYIKEAVKDLRLSPLNVLISDKYLEIFRDVVAPDSGEDLSRRELYVASRSDISPVPPRIIVSPISAERDLQEFELGVQAERYTEMLADANLEIVQRIPGTAALDVHMSQDSCSDSRMTHTTGSRPRASPEYEASTDALDFGPHRKKFTKNKRLRKLRRAATEHVGRGGDDNSETSRSSLTPSEVVPRTGASPSSLETFYHHPTIFVEHIRQRGKYWMLSRCPHELVKYLLDYFKGDPHMAEIGWAVWVASGNKIAEPDQAAQNLVQFISDQFRVNEIPEGDAVAFILQHNLVHPGSSDISKESAIESFSLLEKLVRKMQSYGPLYVPNYLMHLNEEHKHQTQYLNNLTRPIMARDLPLCAECNFINAICPACSDVLDCVKRGTLGDDALSILSDKFGPLVMTWPCACAAEDEICERCLNFAVEIRGLEPILNQRHNQIGSCGALNNPLSFVDIITKRDECFPAGFRAQKILEFNEQPAGFRAGFRAEFNEQPNSHLSRVLSAMTS